MNRIFYGILLSVLVVLNGYAGVQLGDADTLLSEWGGGSWNYCAASPNIPADACIGTMEHSCNSIPTMDTSKDKKCKFTGLPSSMVYARNYTDEAAIRMLVATSINANGAYFCPIQIEAKNKNKGDAWTEYAYATSTDKCVWLCKNGYAGDGCAKEVAYDTSGNATNLSSCDANLLTRANFKSVARVSSGANIENSVAMFRANHNEACGVHEYQEHDIILAVTGWLESGHGAWVSPLEVHARRDCWKKMLSFPVLTHLKSPTHKAIMVCKDGYKYNETKTDCVEISAEKCFDAKCKNPKDCLCSGWDKYNEAEHVLVKDKSSDNICYRYRCKEDNKGLESRTSHKCIDCVAGGRTGIAEGVCIKCEKGKVFDATKSDSDYCVETRKLSKSDLKYGFQVSKSNVKKASAENKEYGACWEVVEPRAYSDCVLNSGKITQEAPVEGSISQVITEEEIAKFNKGSISK